MGRAPSAVSGVGILSAMTSGDIAQVVVGVIAIVVGVYVSYALYQRNKKDASTTQQHGDDLKAVKEALDVVDRTAEKLSLAPMTRSELDSLGLEDAIKTLNEIGRRVSALSGSLTLVWMLGVRVQIESYPEKDRYEFDHIVDRDGKFDRDHFYDLLKRATGGVVRQYLVAEELKKAAQEARATLNKYWSSQA